MRSACEFSACSSPPRCARNNAPILCYSPSMCTYKGSRICGRRIYRETFSKSNPTVVLRRDIAEQRHGRSLRLHCSKVRCPGRGRSSRRNDIKTLFVYDMYTDASCLDECKLRVRRSVGRLTFHCAMGARGALLPRWKFGGAPRL